MAAYPAEPAARGAEIADCAVEFITRQIYWRIPALSNWYRRRAPTVQSAEREQLSAALEEAGIRPGALVLLHSGLSNVSLRHRGATMENPISVAAGVLADVLALLGPSGTLAAPSHPLFPGDPEFMVDHKDRLTLEYNPAATPSGVGLLSELFRRRIAVKRSLYPLSALCCLGSRSDAILGGNLSEGALPHGAESGYFRFSRMRGTIVSIGTPLIRCMTMIHVAEELRDKDWPIPGFFWDRTFRIHNSGEVKTWRVRERRPHYVRCLLLRQLRRDLLREGLLHERRAGNLRVDHADAHGIVEYMLKRNRNSTYPYFWPRTARAF